MAMRSDSDEREMIWDDAETGGDAIPSFDLTPEVPESVPKSDPEPSAAAHRPSTKPASTSVYEKQTPNVQPVQFTQFESVGPDHSMGNLELLMDVPLPVSVELGHTTMAVKDIMALGPGSIIELEKAAGENVDILVNGRLIARGEVVVIEENFGVRIVEFVGNPEKAVQQ